MRRRNKNITGLHLQMVSTLLLTLMIFFPYFSSAQKEKQFIYKGNSAYEKKDYKQSESLYKNGLSKNKNSYKAGFNLGDSYYKQERYEEAAEQFQELTHMATSRDTLARTYHNLGNALLKSKKYQESIDAYKNALKNNPNDQDTRYNLCYAQQMLKQQQQQQQKNNKDKNKDKDKKDKDKKDKDKDKDKDKKDQDKDKDKDKDQKDKQGDQKQQNQISKEDAKRILEALQNDEKNLQDKARKNKIPGRKITIEKDW